MGTLQLYDDHKTSSDGIRFQFSAYSTTSDMLYPEEGCVWLNVTGNGQEYRATICCADYEDRWMRRFVDAFCDNLPFRERFLDLPSEPRKPHATVTVIIEGNNFEIDEAIAPAIVALNECGAKTAFCCQGGKSQGTPYISLRAGQFPEELVQAWKGAGFRVNLDSVYADSSFGLTASQAFVQSLSDWLAGRLDTTGACYRVSEDRPNSLPAIPASPSAALSKDMRNLISKGKKAKFGAFAAIRSGRDRFSGMKRDALVALCDEKRIAPIWNMEDEVLQISALRWHLRGLPVDMAIHKVLVDKEISDNAQKNKRR